MANLPLDPTAFSSALANAIQSSDPDGDSQFIKMSKAGEWMYGQDETDVQEGSIWAVDPRSIQKGFVAWDDGTLMGEEMSPIFGGGPAILKHQLPAIDGGSWKEQIGFTMVCTNGDDEGTQCVFKTSSKGGRKAVKKYMSELQGQMTDNPDNCVALVNLETDFYKHKEYGRIYNPILIVTKWVTLDTAPAAASEEEPPKETAEEEPAKQPKRKRRGVGK